VLAPAGVLVVAGPGGLRSGGYRQKAPTLVSTDAIGEFGHPGRSQPREHAIAT
jgi:hypothetical protein